MKVELDTAITCVVCVLMAICIVSVSFVMFKLATYNECPSIQSTQETQP